VGWATGYGFPALWAVHNVKANRAFALTLWGAWNVICTLYTHT